DGTGLLGGLDHQLLVQGLPGEHVDDPDRDALCLQSLIGLQGLVHHDAGGDDGGLILVGLMQHHTLADLELASLAVHLDDALADEPGVGDALVDVHQLAGDTGKLVIVGGVQHCGFGDGEVHGCILQRHVGAAVERGGDAGVGTQNMDRQPGIGS
ncbi:hypothetical protein NBJODN_NBJODN_11955, partial [Dysosmobacter welbionis]